MFDPGTSEYWDLEICHLPQSKLSRGKEIKSMFDRKVEKSVSLNLSKLLWTTH